METEMEQIDRIITKLKVLSGEVGRLDRLLRLKNVQSVCLLEENEKLKKEISELKEENLDLIDEIKMLT